MENLAVISYRTKSPARTLAGVSFVCLSLLSLSGCTGCVSGPSTADSGPPAEDAGSDDCQLITIGDVGIDVQFDVETVYSAPVETELGSSAADHLVFNFVNINERFGPAAIGTFSLTSEPNDNRGTCAECVSVFVDQLGESSQPDKTLFQSAGSMRLDTDPRTGTFRGRVEGLELVEVEIDGFTLESSPVPNGACVRIDDFDVDFKHVPAEWTCDEALYDDGSACNCDCGSFDPDCECDPFADPNCPAVIEDDCAEGSVCTFEGCKQTCDIFSDPVVPCPDGLLCAFDLGVQTCINAPGRVHTALVGEACTGESIFAQYCDVENTLPKGVCDDFDDTCQPVCDDNETCAEGEVCYTIAGGLPGEGGLGYCRPEEDASGVPEEWACPVQSYGDGSVCDCGCGASDVDCEDAQNEIPNCFDGETCVDGVCQ